MKLGNSNGQNKGKVYLKKDQIDIVYANEAAVFNDWVSKNYNLLIDYFQNHRIYDEDAFNETYKSMYERILFSGARIKNYKSYFVRSYFTNRILSKKKESRYCELSIDVESCKEDSSLDQYKETEDMHRQLSTEILDYVYSKYNLRSFELFKMYVNLKPAINYQTLSDITGVKHTTIKYIISSIKKDIISNEYFSKQARDIL